MSQTTLTPGETADLRKYAVKVAMDTQPFSSFNQAAQQTTQSNKKDIDKILSDAEKVYQFIIKK